jgi:heme exporter protein A
VYGRVRALVGVTWKFEAGTSTLVRGANGSGKSTLLAVVGAIVRPTSGHVEQHGLGQGLADLRRSLGWVSHESLCYPDLTARQNVELAARLQGCAPKAAFERAADRFELGPFADRPLRTYSRGQKQRVALARALVHAPKVVLMDEPTTGLDASGAQRLAATVREETARGAIVVVTTHDPAFASAINGPVIELVRGRCVVPPRAVG